MPYCRLRHSASVEELPGSGKRGGLPKEESPVRNYTDGRGEQRSLKTADINIAFQSGKLIVFWLVEINVLK